MTEEVGTMVDISLPERRDAGARHPDAAAQPGLRISPFWQHFLEMFAAMWVGMAVGMPVYLAFTGASSFRAHPVQSLVAMALSMTVPMFGWMLFRGHGWRNSAEMAGAMLVPAIPFLILGSVGAISGAACCPYMVLSTLAMLGLMFYRRDEYSKQMRNPWHGHLQHQHH
jgi:hypothetical protein